MVWGFDGFRTNQLICVPSLHRLRYHKGLGGLVYARLLLACVIMSACKSDKAGPSAAVEEVLDRSIPEIELPEPTIRRLTRSQYNNALQDLFGNEIVLPSSLEPDETTDGLLAIGASLTTISPRGVEQYENSAYSVVGQAIENEATRDELIHCSPEDIVDTACAEEVLESFGERAWRRPLDETELASLVEISGAAALVLEDFYQG